MQVQRAFDSAAERQLSSIALARASAAALPALVLPSAHFACLIAWDARGASPADVEAFVGPLLKAGASYVVCWGPDCERVHDLIDELVSHPDNPYGLPEGACLMTSWHSDEPLDEALWFFLNVSWPDDHFQESTGAGVALSVGSADWASQIARALDDPRAFSRRVCEDSPD